MGVHEAGNEGHPGAVDLPGPRAPQAVVYSPLAHRDDPAILDGDPAGMGVAGLHGEGTGVAKDKVGVPLRCHCVPGIATESTENSHYRFLCGHCVSVATPFPPR